MTTDKGIPIKNVYYMLAYAFKELRHNNYEHIAGEDFDDIYDLFAEILSKGIACLLKRGLHKEYVATADTLPTLRGKLDLEGTLKERIGQRARLACEYDRLSENNPFNQILKASAMLLLRHHDVNRLRKHALWRLMPFLEGVDDVKPSGIRWDALRYDGNTRTYQMLHSLCFFLLHSKLLTTENGGTRMEQFSDDHINLLFQRFVMEYYKRHFPQYGACSKQIKWAMGDRASLSAKLLPIMQTDIFLTLGDRTLIIDTKYYSHTTQEHFGKQTLHSQNLYQIHAYVTNEDKLHTGRIDGLLLYAKTGAEAQPDVKFSNPDGNLFMARTLDLSLDFKEIKAFLNGLADYRHCPATV